MDENLILDRLERITQQLQQMEARFDDKLQQMEARLEARFDGKLQQMEARFDGKLQQMEDRLTTRLDAGLAEVRSEVAALSARVDIIKETVDSIDAGLADVKKLLAYHEAKWIEHDKEIWYLKQKSLLK